MLSKSLEHERNAAAQALERAELRHDAPLGGRHVGQRDRRQAAGERRRVRRREVLEHAARQGHGEMGVGVGESRHHHLAAAVDAVGRGIARLEVGIRADRGDFLALDRDRSAVMHRVVVVAGDDDGVMDDRGQCFPQLSRSTVTYVPQRYTVRGIKGSGHEAASGAGRNWRQRDGSGMRYTGATGVAAGEAARHRDVPRPARRCADRPRRDGRRPAGAHRDDALHREIDYADRRARRPLGPTPTTWRFPAAARMAPMARAC